MSNYTQYYQQAAPTPAPHQQYIDHAQQQPITYPRRPLPPPTSTPRQRPESMPPTTMNFQLPPLSSGIYPPIHPGMHQQVHALPAAPQVARRPLPTPTPVQSVPSHARAGQQSQSVDLGGTRIESTLNRPLPHSPPQAIPQTPNRFSAGPGTVSHMAARFDRDRAYTVSDANPYSSRPFRPTESLPPSSTRWHNLQNPLPPPTQPLPQPPSIPPAAIKPPSQQQAPPQQYVNPPPPQYQWQGTPPSNSYAPSVTRSLTRVAPLPTPPNRPATAAPDTPNGIRSTDTSPSKGRRALPPSPSMPPDLSNLRINGEIKRPGEGPVPPTLQSIAEGRHSHQSPPVTRDLPKPKGSFADQGQVVRELPTPALPQVKALPNRGPRPSNRNTVVGIPDSQRPLYGSTDNPSWKNTSTTSLHQRDSLPAAAKSPFKKEPEYSINGHHFNLDDAPPPATSPVLRRSPSPAPSQWTADKPPRAPQATYAANIPMISLPEEPRAPSRAPQISVSTPSPPRRPSSGVPGIVLNGNNDTRSSPPATSSSARTSRILPQAPGPSGLTINGLQAILPSALQCAGCTKSISGRIISAMNQRWHPDCFRCSVCNEGLEHVSAYEKDGKPYCHLDYHEKFAPQCYHCKTPIVDERFITLDDPALGKRTYHDSHFFCAECGDPFLSPSRKGGNITVNGDGAYDPENDEDDVGFTVFKGHPYCEACHVRLRMPKCKKCKKSIRHGMQAVEALGGKWCWECFTCAKCDKPFENPAFFQRDNKPFCEPCFSLILRNEI